MVGQGEDGIFKCLYCRGFHYPTNFVPPKIREKSNQVSKLKDHNTPPQFQRFRDARSTREVKDNIVEVLFDDNQLDVEHLVRLEKYVKKYIRENTV
jgi:hypothetical protein